MSFKPGLTLSIANSFNHFAKRTSRTAGHPQTFGLALAVTTIVTFLMVFLIQNTQTGTAWAMQIKLDELDPRPERRSQRNGGLGG